jgi:hypothetical protein
MEATTTDRRAETAPADRRKLDPLWRGLLLAIAIAFLAWAAKPLVPVTQARFEADSIARDRDNARRDQTLDRIDARVGAIYCASLPADRQAGCR